VVEIETVLSRHPFVLEAAVVGEPDPIRDEVPIAYVVQQPGKPSVAVDELEQWCARHLSPAKRPRRLEIVDELPRTSVGKIKKFMLTQASQIARPKKAEVG
jgi:crotonobetaine/carnitine-CoA ligase